jgi:hypothetical protein
MCKGTMPCASGDHLEILKENYLIFEDGRIPDATREVVLNAFEEKGGKLKLGWPTASLKTYPDEKKTVKSTLKH